MEDGFEIDEVRVGVLLEEATPVGDDLDELDETGHVPASGYRGEHRAGTARRIAVLGDQALRTAATAVGLEVATVLTGVVAGIVRRAGADAADGATVRAGSFDIGDVELKFGVKAVLGAGKAVEALLTATGEATVEVTVKLKQRPPGSAS
ncbi:hypothetical protein [Dactylosporangium darangshiense]|uniref:Asp23/Gls24 family envelope stress response protein n=1 Tax=Dactylosporangium darangshiense TaxID=579108 RepID=A0ABP8DT75_9ACTN